MTGSSRAQAAYGTARGDWQCLRCGRRQPAETIHCECVRRQRAESAAPSRDVRQLVDHLLAPIARLTLLSSYGEVAQEILDLSDCAHVMASPVEREMVRQAAIELIAGLKVVQDPATVVNLAWRNTAATLAEIGAQAHD